MKNPLHSEKSTNLGLLLARVPAGVQFVITGCYTITSTGVKTFVSDYAGSIPSWMSDSVGEAILHAIPFLQVIVGLCLVLGFFSRLAGFLASLILATFMILSPPSFAGDVPRNVVFLGVTLMVMLAGTGNISLDLMIWGKSAGSPAKRSSDKD